MSASPDPDGTSHAHPREETARLPSTARRDGELHGGLVRLIFPDTASFGWMKHSPSCGASAAVRRPLAHPSDAGTDGVPMARCSPVHEAGPAPTSETRPFSPPSVGPTHPSHIAGRFFAGPLAPLNPHRLLPPPTSVDEHYRAVSSEPLPTTTNPDLLLAGVAGSDTGGRTATLPGLLFLCSEQLAQRYQRGDGPVRPLRRYQSKSAAERGNKKRIHQRRQRPTSSHRLHRPPLDNASSYPARSGNRWALRNVRFLAGSASGRREGPSNAFRGPRSNFVPAGRPTRPCPCRPLLLLTHIGHSVPGTRRLGDESILPRLPKGEDENPHQYRLLFFSLVAADNCRAAALFSG